MMDTVDSPRQAGDNDVIFRLFPDLRIPDGLTIADLGIAEDMILDWEERCELRALVLVAKVFDFLMAARRANSVKTGL